MKTVVVIDYGAGNIRSVSKALERVVREHELNYRILVTSDAQEVRDADYVVLPGVGAFIDCYRGLCSLQGMLGVLNETVLQKARPFLGICVGMQLMAYHGYEVCYQVGLSWIEGSIVRLSPRDPLYKVPHIGWNSITLRSPQHAVLSDLPQELYGYFVHSYHFECIHQEHCLATTDFDHREITAIVGRDNLVGMQFHPEKSQSVGLRVLGNFVRWFP